MYQELPSLQRAFLQANSITIIVPLAFYNEVQINRSTITTKIASGYLNDFNSAFSKKIENNIIAFTMETL